MRRLKCGIMTRKPYNISSSGPLRIYFCSYKHTEQRVTTLRLCIIGLVLLQIINTGPISLNKTVAHQPKNKNNRFKNTYIIGYGLYKDVQKISSRLFFFYLTFLCRKYWFVLLLFYFLFFCLNNFVQIARAEFCAVINLMRDISNTSGCLEGSKS